MTKNTRVKQTSQEWSCLDHLGSDIMFFIHKGSRRMLTILPPGYAQTPIHLIHDFMCLISKQAANLVSCAVNFLNECPFLSFLHLHRLPFRKILKTMCFVGPFCCFKIYSFHQLVTRVLSFQYDYFNTASMKSSFNFLYFVTIFVCSRKIVSQFCNIILNTDGNTMSK